MLNTFSFIVISYNRAKDTIDALKNILWLDNVEGWEKEIIILNNNSSEDYLPLEHYIAQCSIEIQKTIHYIHHNENLGVSGGRNFCIKKATGKYLFFLDDDAEIVQQNAIAIILKKFEQYKSENLGIIGFLGKNPYNNTYQSPIKNQALIKDKNEIFYNLFYGYGHVFPKALIENTGYYQEDFFYGMEENDLSYASIKKGYAILFSKDILVLHKVNPNGREPNIQTKSRLFQNRMIVVYKHLPFIYVLTQFIMWSFYFLYHSKINIIAYFKALIQLKQRIKLVQRKPMNQKGMAYLRKVQARLWY